MQTLVSARRTTLEAAARHGAMREAGSRLEPVWMLSRDLTAPACLARLLCALGLADLVIFADGLKHMQATSWEQQGKANAP